jgi:hypothetical protein
MPHETDYEVGYKKPPKHSQFKKGQSGNPRGRPRGSKNLATMVREAIDEKVTITEKGRHRQITLFEASLKHLCRKSAQGDHRATQALLRLVQELDLYREPEKPPETSPKQPRYIVVLPHNGRDPLTPEQLATSEEYYARKERERKRQEAANENEEEAPDNCSSAA